MTCADVPRICVKVSPANNYTLPDAMLNGQGDPKAM